MNSHIEGAKVLLVNHAIPPWENTGTPITTLNQARGLQERGLDVAILVPSQAEVWVGFKKEKLDGFTLYRVPAFDRHRAFLGILDKEALRLFLATIAYITRDFSPDIVHINDYVGMPAEIIEVFHGRGCLVVRSVCNDEEICHQDYPVVDSGSAGKLCSGPDSATGCAVCYLTHVAGQNRERIPQNKSDRLAVVLKRRMVNIRRLYRDKIDAVVFTSEPFKNHFTAFVPVDAERIGIIPRGFISPAQRSVNPYRKATGEEVRFAFFGTLMLSKGIDVLLRAFERVAGQKSFHLDLHGSLGNPKIQTWLRRLEEEFPGRIVYHGDYQPLDFAGLAGRIDLAIVPSYFDAYNRIIRECLTCGVPVIASDFFGAFIVRDGLNGLKIPIGDDERLAAVMRRVIDEPDLIETLRAGARVTVIPTLDEEIGAIMDLYEKLLQVRRKGKAKIARGRKKREKDFYPGKNSWIRMGDVYLRGIDRLVLSILENCPNLPVSFPSALLLDTGAGYNDRDIVRERITRGEDGSYKVTFDLRGFENILGVRFDPWEGAWGRLRLDEIVAEFGSTGRKKINLSSVRAVNGELGAEGFFAFKTSDPILELRGVAGAISRLTIRGCLEFMDVYQMEEEWRQEKEAWHELLTQKDREARNQKHLLAIVKVVRGWHESEPVARPTILFGTGSLAEWILKLLDRNHFLLRCCFDNLPRAVLFHDLAVQKPSFIPGVQVIIASMHVAEIKQQLLDLGYSYDDLLSPWPEET
jgi:glycosyltransferase involved in cell wall biosynthesis